MTLTRITFNRITSNLYTFSSDKCTGTRQAYTTDSTETHDWAGVSEPGIVLWTQDDVHVARQHALGMFYLHKQRVRSAMFQPQHTSPNLTVRTKSNVHQAACM